MFRLSYCEKNSKKKLIRVIQFFDNFRPSRSPLFVGASCARDFPMKSDKNLNTYAYDSLRINRPS